MAMVNLDARRRDSVGKGSTRKLRALQHVPSVLYGEGVDGWPLAIPVKDLEKLFQSGRAETTIINLRIEGDEVRERKSIIREVQRDPISGALRHIDFQHISLTKEITVVVPLTIEGVAPGVKNAGGILDHSLRELEVECLPNAIPDEITVDISSLEIGDSIHVRDLQLDTGKIVTDPGRNIVTVVAPAVFEEEKPVEEEEAEEPEVVEKGKKEEEAEPKEKEAAQPADDAEKKGD